MGIDEESSAIDTEETDEGDGDTDGSELSEVSGLNGREGEDMETTEPSEPQLHPLPDELNRTIEPPLGIDGDKMVKNQEEPKSKSARKKESSQEQLMHKLYNQLIKKLQSDDTHDEMKQIQKRLAQVEKNSTNIKLQQQLGKELLGQVKLMQRRLEKIDNAIGGSKTKGNIKKEKIQGPATKVIRAKKRSR